MCIMLAGSSIGPRAKRLHIGLRLVYAPRITKTVVMGSLFMQGLKNGSAYMAHKISGLSGHKKEWDGSQTSSFAHPFLLSFYSFGMVVLWKI